MLGDHDLSRGNVRLRAIGVEDKLGEIDAREAEILRQMDFRTIPFQQDSNSATLSRPKWQRLDKLPSVN